MNTALLRSSSSVGWGVESWWERVRRWLTREEREREDEEMGAERRAGKRRLIARDKVFGQSHGRLNVRRCGAAAEIRSLYVEDIFHTLLYSPSYRLFAVLTLIYMFFIVIFAFFYWMNAGTCAADLNNFMDAYFFSVETIMTIGFGASDPFFNNCFSMAFLITLQSLIGVFLDCVCFGTVFVRLARGQRRAATVLFSSCAVVRRYHGQVAFMFRVAEARKHQLVEAHVRCYALYRDPDEPDEIAVHWLSITEPPEEAAAMLLLSFAPQVVVPLVGANCCFKDGSNPLIPRDTDASQLDEESLIAHWNAVELEIVVVVEGIEPATSSTIQARYSYTAQDLRWNHRFAPCFFYERDARPGLPCSKLDFDQLHRTFPLDIEHPGFIH